MDALQQKIDEFGLEVVWEGELQGLRVFDVQLFDGEVAFRLKRISEE